MRPVYPAVGDDKTIRLACCVPHCRRTFRNDKNDTPWPEGSEVMCGKHGRLIDKPLRARERHMRKLLEKVDRMFEANETRTNAKMVLLVSRWCRELWARGKIQAIERAAGIA